MIGYRELLGERLERTRDRGDLLLPVLGALAAAGELKIVDDDERDVVFRLEPARPGAHVEGRNRRRVVDEDRRLGKEPRRVREALDVLRRGESAAHLLRVDLSLGAEEPLNELLLRHFEAEDRDRFALEEPDVLRDVEREARLAHRGAPRDDDHIARVEPGGVLVEIDETAREPRDAYPRLVHALNLLEPLLEHVLDVHEPLAHPRLGDLEYLLLRGVEDGVRLAARRVGVLGDVGRRRG